MSTAKIVPSELPAVAESPTPGRPAPGSLDVRVLRAAANGAVEREDRVTVEAPLEFQLYHPSLGLEPASFGATMRTPGDDEHLAAGLLFGEGIVSDVEDIEVIETSTRRPNVVNVRLKASARLELQAPAQRFSAGSSCGVCGTTGLDSAIARAAAGRVSGLGRIAVGTLLQLPTRMRIGQATFGDTGGIHAAALFDLAGNLVGLAEDVGRHNAFDKLVGENLLAKRLPLSDHVVLLSGRASFELVQKAIRAGVGVLAAIGAPSSLAVNLAMVSGITLAGFLRDQHCNVYANPQRLEYAPAAAP